MSNSMEKNLAKNWFGAPPPDLTNEINLRGADWVYSYLLGFYADEDRPYGVNNTVLKNVAMPNVLAELQGIQKKICSTRSSEKNGEQRTRTVSKDSLAKLDCVLKVDPGSGKMNETEFKQTVSDLTNFLIYTSNPNAEASKRIGFYVILFLLVLTLLFYLLYKEYWKDIS